MRLRMVGLAAAIAVCVGLAVSTLVFIAHNTNRDRRLRDVAVLGAVRAFITQQYLAIRSTPTTMWTRCLRRGPATSPRCTARR